jgi:hypothetical protein
VSGWFGVREYNRATLQVGFAPPSSSLDVLHSDARVFPHGRVGQNTHTHTHTHMLTPPPTHTHTHTSTVERLHTQSLQRCGAQVERQLLPRHSQLVAVRWPAWPHARSNRTLDATLQRRPCQYRLATRAPDNHGLRDLPVHSRQMACLAAAPGSSDPKQSARFTSASQERRLPSTRSSLARFRVAQRTCCFSLFAFTCSLVRLFFFCCCSQQWHPCPNPCLI